MKTDAARPCPEEVLEGQPEALDCELEVLTSESEEDTDSEDIEKDFDH